MFSFAMSVALCNEMFDKELKKPAGEKITDLPKPKEIKKDPIYYTV